MFSGMKERIAFFVSVFLMHLGVLLNAQNVVNNGTGLVINNGAWLVIGGDYSNLNNTQSGFVDNDGHMVVYGDFTQNAANNVFVNVEAVPDGETILPAASDQFIAGSTIARFENLKVSGGHKILEAASTEVAGVFTIAAVFELNSNMMVLHHPLPGAIQYQSGYLLAETHPVPGLGILRWNLGDATGSFAIPFGSGLSGSNDLNLILNISQPAAPNAHVDFSTYPTPSTNVPLPDPVTTLDPYLPDVTVNRFWLIDGGHPVGPGGSITFSYTQSDVTPIQESSLGAIRFNEDVYAWDDRSPEGTPDPIFNTLTTSTILPADFYKNWTLTGTVPEDFVYVPSSFSPNGDGRNDYFYPIIGNSDMLNDYGFYIFDRWGTEIFFSGEQNQGWDGVYKGAECQQDTYVYLFRYRDVLGKISEKTGRVTLIR